MAVTRRQFVQNIGSLGAGILSLSAPPAKASSPHLARKRTTATEQASPIDWQRHGVFGGIMDIYYKNSMIDLAQAKRLGVKAVIYRTSLGLYDLPAEQAAYHRAKEQARSLGLLWGAFHVPSHEDVDQQLEAFFRVEDGADGKTLMILDWEETSRGTATIQQMRDAVTRFRRIRGYYPMIYGGHIVAEQCGSRRDDLLARCPLWYIYLLNGKRPVLKLPKATWSDYTLWQYSTEHRAGRDPYPPDVLPGADFSRFKGTADDLDKAWPFRQA